MAKKTDTKEVVDMKTVPKYIKEKCKRMVNLCMEAYQLRKEVEEWCRKNGIETYTEEWYDRVRDDIGGCDYILDADEIEELLNLSSDD